MYFWVWAEAQENVIKRYVEPFTDEERKIRDTTIKKLKDSR